MLERENINNFIADDLALRNRNWGQIEDELAKKADIAKPVTPERTSFFTPGKNLFDKNKVIADKYVRYQDGVLSTNTSFVASDYIPVEEGETYYKQQNEQFAFFDDNKIFVSGVENAVSFTVPVGVAYVRLSVRKIHLDTFQLEKGAVATTYEAYNIKIEKEKIRGLETNDVSVIAKNIARKGNIVCIGDSITRGVLDPQNYPFWLRQNEKLNITNVGVSGVRIAHFIDNKNLYLDLSPLPDTALVMLGTNDIGSGRSIAQMKSDYKALIDVIISNGITPIILTVLPREDTPEYNATIRYFNDWLKLFAKSYGHTLVDTYTVFAKSDGLPKTGYLFDMLHPSIKGHMELAKEVEKFLPHYGEKPVWNVAGGENYVPDPTFQSAWTSYSTTGVTITTNLEEHPDAGNWQKITRSGGVDGNSQSYIYKEFDLPAGVVTGDTIYTALDIDTGDISDSGCSVETIFHFRTNSALINAPKILSKCTEDIDNKRFHTYATVPAGATKVRLVCSIFGVGACNVKFGRAIFKKVEPLQ